MVDKEILKYCLNEVKNKVDKCNCTLSENKKYELNLESGEISLLRTTIDDTFVLTVLKDNKKGSISINKTDKDALDEAIKNVIDLCENSEPDEAFDIAPYQEAKEFCVGDMIPDLDRMFDLLSNYVNIVKEKYPTIKLMDTVLSFDINTRYFMNSNNVDFKQTKGIYNFGSLFAAKKGSKSSSFNYLEFSLKDLEKELLDCSSLDTVLQRTTKQVETNNISDKFKGDIVITPECLGTLVTGYISTYLTDAPLISGTSILKDKLNKEIASPIFTLHSKPLSEDLAGGYKVTAEGFEAENTTIIEKGILKNFLLTIYGANKTKLNKVKASGCYIVEAGNKSYEDIIKSIKKGVLVCRISGGDPNNNGDLSVVIKNSYYIEDGEIKFPLNETMITTNLVEAFKNIKEISKETVNFGNSIYPYVKMSDVLISGK